MKGTIILKKRTPKQIAALVCVILIILSYIILFVVSLIDSTKSGELFQACLLTTVFLPILCWIYIWIYGQVKQKHTIADLDILQTGENEKYVKAREEMEREMAEKLKTELEAEENEVSDSTQN